MSYQSLVLSTALLLLFNSCKENNKNTADNSSNTTLDKSKLDSFAVDKSQSIIYWLGSSPTGTHNGSLNIQDGILYSSNKIIRGGEISIDMNSITNLDLQNPAKKSDLENHLKSADFFNVDSFPLSHFKMSSITMISDTVYNAIIHGYLSIKNVTKPLQLKCKVDHTDEMIFITVPEFTLDRTQYNIMYKSKKLMDVIKDKFIHDEITLSIKLIAKKI